MAEQLIGADEITEIVRERYAEAARRAATASAGCCGEPASCGCGSAAGAEAATFGSALYPDADREALPAAAKAASLGCGNPTAIAELREGESVLDLGSGGGIDVILSARRVGPSGKAYGLDMTDEMLELARSNLEESGLENAEFLKGTIEAIPLPDGSVDVIISNCVINLSGDKTAVFREAARVLRAGGRLAISDVVAEPGMDDATRADMAAWTGCVAGALTESEFRAELDSAGFEGVEIEQTHRVHDQAFSAIVRARVAR